MPFFRCGNNTGRTEILWKVLDGPFVQALVSAKPAVVKMGTMGKRPVQNSSHQMAETKVSGATPFIPTLAIGTSIM